MVRERAVPRLPETRFTSSPEAFSPPWPSDCRARGRPVLRRQGLDVRSLRRDAARLGRHAASLDHPGRSGLDAVPHAEPAAHAAPGGGDANPPNPGDRGDRGGRRARRVAPNLPAGRRRRGHRRGHRIGLSARPREPDRGGTRAPCLRPAVASRPGAPGARLSRGWLRHRLLQRFGGRPRRKLARAAMGRRCRPRAAPSPEDARRPSVRGRGRVRDAGVGRSSVRAINRGRARDAGLARHGRRVARRRSPTRAEAEPRIVSSAAPRGSNRLEVAEEEVAVLLVFNRRADVPCEGQVCSEVSLPPRDRIGAGESLVGEGEREVLDPVFFARGKGSHRMVCRRLGPTEDRIDVGDLPVADRSIHRRSDLAPVKAGRMRGVDHALVFGERARLLEEAPDLVEQTYGHLAMPLPLCRRGFACHGSSLRRIRILRQRLGVGLGRFELPSQAPKARRIDQATPQPQMRGRTGTRDKYVVAYASRGLFIEENASRAANRTASSLDLRGRHPVRLSRSSASCIVRTSPAHPRPPPAAPVHASTTPGRPTSAQIASARARTVIASSLPTLYTENGPDAPGWPASIPVTTSSTWTYDFAAPGSDPRISSRFGFRTSLRTKSTTTPWPLLPPTTLARRKTNAWTPNVCAYADRSASPASFDAPYTEIGSRGL